MRRERKFWSWLGILAISLLIQFVSIDQAVAAVIDWTQEQKFLVNVWQIVNRAYVDDSFNHQNWYKVRKKYANQRYKSREETYDAIQEMLASLDDPFTRLLKPEQFESMQTSTAGVLTGVGLQIAVDGATKTLTVVSPIEGSPAEKAGLRSLDRIVSIDNVPTDTLTLDECAERMRGEVGTQVKLTVIRQEQLDAAGNLLPTPESKTFDVTVTRGHIEVNPVISKLNQEGEYKVGYIRLNQFNANASADMAKAIHKLESQGAERYVLDLRGNPGGLLQAGIEIARQWLPEGAIVYTVDRKGIQESYAATNAAITLDPLVVITDGGTASASEILAAALHDNGRAQLLGTKTYGKGLVQSLFALEDGAGVAVTIAKYETPNHQDINKVGIKPDVEIKLTAPLKREQLGTKDDMQYEAALKLLDNAPVFAQPKNSTNLAANY